MLRWLLLLGFLFYAGDLVLSSSDDSLQKDAALKQEAQNEIRTMRRECVRYGKSQGELPDRLDRLEGADSLDPWGHHYRYVRLDTHRAQLLSLGADGKEGGIGLAADIVSKIRLS